MAVSAVAIKFLWGRVSVYLRNVHGELGPSLSLTVAASETVAEAVVV